MAGAPVGNQNAKKARLWTEAVKRAISRKANGDLSGGLDSLAERLVNAADAGEQWAIKEVGDRLDGKPAQALVGDPDQPLELNIGTVERKIVRPDSSDTNR